MPTIVEAISHAADIAFEVTAKRPQTMGSPEQIDATLYQAVFHELRAFHPEHNVPACFDHLQRACFAEIHLKGERVGQAPVSAWRRVRTYAKRRASSVGQFIH
jgi:hypothetical protein